MCSIVSKVRNGYIKFTITALRITAKIVLLTFPIYVHWQLVFSCTFSFIPTWG